MRVNMTKAKSQLSRLGRMAWKGEEVVITKAGEPYLRLQPYGKPVIKRKPGRLKGQIWVAPDFDERAEDVVDSFYRSRVFPEESN